MKEAKEILALIEESDSIVLTSHKSPDGDSVGSTMAMFYFIKSLGKTAKICHPDPAPNFLNWVKGDANFIDFVNHPKDCLLYTSPSPRDLSTSRMPSSA